jgi:sialate O-acetylesterase
MKNKTIVINMYIHLRTSVEYEIASIVGNAALRFANYIQDHMVLQRAPQRSIVWGYGDASKLTTLRINDKIYTTMSRSESANELGEIIWSVTLDPVEDEGPFDIHVSQPLANGTRVTITLQDVLFGDVWLCSGQSNMQLTVSMIYNSTLEIQNAGNYPKIRVFTAALNESLVPIEEINGTYLNWSLASPQSIGGPDAVYMSAVCWLYGRMIHVALGGRPIGLIATSFYGTPIALWMPPKALEDCNITTYVLEINLFSFYPVVFDFL